MTGCREVLRIRTTDLWLVENFPIRSSRRESCEDSSPMTPGLITEDGVRIEKTWKFQIEILRSCEHDAPTRRQAFGKTFAFFGGIQKFHQNSSDMHTCKGSKVFERVQTSAAISVASQRSEFDTPCECSCGYYRIWVQVPKLECKLEPCKLWQFAAHYARRGVRRA